MVLLAVKVAKASSSDQFGSRVAMCAGPTGSVKLTKERGIDANTAGLSNATKLE